MCELYGVQLGSEMKTSGRDEVEVNPEGTAWVDRLERPSS